MSKKETESLKVVLLGDSGVGKTSIINRFANNIFESKFMSTLTSAYFTKTMKFDDFGGKEIKFELWDTAGQERYRSITKILFKDAQVIIFVYDITKIGSFNEIKNYWYNQVKENCPKNIILGLAGNKADLFDNESVTEKEGKNFAEEIGAIFNLTSPLENFGINELFQDIGHKFLKTLFNNNLGNKGDIGTEKNKKKIRDINLKKRKKCC